MDNDKYPESTVTITTREYRDLIEEATRGSVARSRNYDLGETIETLKKRIKELEKEDEGHGSKEG